MRYIGLTQLSYGSGKFLLYTSRFNNTNTAGASVSNEFIRKSIELATSSSSGDFISICHVSIGSSVDGTIPTVDNVFGISVSRRDIDFLSEDNNLADFNCIIISGYNNGLSPLVKANLLNYVNSGGGIIFDDIDINEDTIDIFDPSYSVLVTSSDFNVDDGAILWTDIGIASSMYIDSFASIRPQLLNSILEGNVNSSWSTLFVFDTDADMIADTGIDETVFNSSDEYLIDGAYMMGRYSSVYENGIAEVKK